MSSGHSVPYDTRFFAILLWLCAAAAVWLLVSPASFTRRALTRRVELVSTEVRQDRLDNAGLARWRNGLASDVAVIEREARKQGYGRPGEAAYPLTPAEVKAAMARLRPPTPVDESPWTSEFAPWVAPALMLLIGAVAAMLFFSNLKVDDPSAPPTVERNPEPKS